MDEVLLTRPTPRLTRDPPSENPLSANFSESRMGGSEHTLPIAGHISSITEQKARLRAASLEGEGLVGMGRSLTVLIVGGYHRVDKPDALEDQLELLKPVLPQR